MLVAGLYKAENNDGILNQYTITMNVKETEKSYIFTLVEINSRYSASQMEYFFSKSKRVVMSKGRRGHAIRVWSNTDFTLYPFQVGVPFYFQLVNEEGKGTEE